jgi:hypothetical protein
MPGCDVVSLGSVHVGKQKADQGAQVTHERLLPRVLKEAEQGGVVTEKSHIAGPDGGEEHLDLIGEMLVGECPELSRLQSFAHPGTLVGATAPASVPTRTALLKLR